MSSIVIKGDTSGQIEIAAPAVAGSNTLTLPASTGTIVDKDGSGNVSIAGTMTANAFSGDGSGLTGVSAGKILQVVSVLKTDVFSTTSTSLVDVTGLTVNITPSSSSNKILVSAYCNGVSTDNAVVQLQRNGTIVGAGDASGSRTRSFAGGFFSPGGLTHGAYSITFLDSPATTSTLTYKIQAGAVGGGTFYLGRNATDNNDAQHCRTPQCITLMEVAA